MNEIVGTSKRKTNVQSYKRKKEIKDRYIEKDKLLKRRERKTEKYRNVENDKMKENVET